MLRQEDILATGELQTRFYAVSPGQHKELLRSSEWHNDESGDLPPDPPGLKTGTVLVADFRAVVEFPKVSLTVETAGADGRDAENAAGINSSAKGDRQLPGQSLKIRYQESDAAKPFILWAEATDLTPQYGEAGVENHTPELKYAVISPSRNTILVFIYDGTELDYLILPLRGQQHPTERGKIGQ